MSAIKDIKKGRVNHSASALVEALSSLETQNAKAVVVACTELGLVSVSSPLPLHDAADILAHEIICTCKGLTTHPNHERNF